VGRGRGVNGRRAWRLATVRSGCVASRGPWSWSASCRAGEAGGDAGSGGPRRGCGAAWSSRLRGGRGVQGQGSRARRDARQRPGAERIGRSAARWREVGACLSHALTSSGMSIATQRRVARAGWQPSSAAGSGPDTAAPDC
jgi:hypothetical protein